jgi:hypothetical protein
MSDPVPADPATLDMVIRWLERWATNTEYNCRGDLGAMFAGTKAAAFREAAEVLRNRPEVLNHD